jgi:drug/metabolite transporter (DMT)-like permease
MSRLGFAYAIITASLFGIGGTFAQFLFTQRGVNMDWLVTMRLLVSGALLLAIALVRDGKKTFAVWQDWPSLILFGLLGMLGVQYTYMAAIEASNTATATVLQYTAPAMVALWLTMRRRRLPDARELAAIAQALASFSSPMAMPENSISRWRRSFGELHLPSPLHSTPSSPARC